MRDAYDQARARHPDIEIDETEFAEFVRERLQEAIPADDVAADLLLACGCARGLAAALRAFETQYLADVPKLVARVESSAAGHAEIQQRLRERLLVSREGAPPKIVDYRGKARLGSWLRVVAVRIALDRKTAGRRNVEGGGDDALAALDDPELEYLRERYQRDFHDAFVAALEQLAPRDRTLLRLHLVDGLNIDHIGKLYDVHRATAARRLSRAREQLFELTRDGLRDKLGVSGSEFQSLARLLRSQLDVSVCRILEESAPEQE